MKEVIEQIIAAEAEAKAVVQAARDEAEDLVGKARQEARLRSEDDLREARREADRLGTEADADAAKRREVRIGEYARELQNSFKLNDDVRADAIGRVTAAVLGRG